MIMLDRWEELSQEKTVDQRTLAKCRDLAFDMCRKIFEVMNFEVQVDSKILRASGRGLVYLFPVRNQSISLKDFDGIPVRAPVRLTPRRRGRPSKKR